MSAFPATHQTWIEQQLEIGASGRTAVNEHVMRVYRDPLAIYVRGSSFHRLGDAHDLVQGFFADRLDRETFFDTWRTERVSLRRWLIGSLKHWLFEEMRRRERYGRAVPLDAKAFFAMDDPGAIAAYDQAAIRSLIVEAWQDAARVCHERNQAAHWTAFDLAHAHGHSIDQIAQHLDVTPARASVMKRTAQRVFQRSIGTIIAWPSATPEEIAAEVDALLMRARAAE